MSGVADTQTLNDAMTTGGILIRTFEAEVREGDGRTLDLRIVPYNVPARVADPPDYREYEEMFVPGAFERQLRSPGRVRMWLNFEHEQGIRGIIGHGSELRDRSDGLHGSFRVHANSDGDKALQLVNDGLLTGVSVEYAALRSRRVEGIVQRLRAHIDQVALCRAGRGAYELAQVLAVREKPPEADEADEPDEPAGDEPPADEPDTAGDEPADKPAEPEPAEPEPAAAAVPYPEGLRERMAALGIEPLSRISTTGRAWDGSPARFSDDEYRRSALICRGSGSPPKEDCSLPVLEPGGALNTNALGAAAAALAGARGGVSGLSPAQRATAARKLIRYYNQANMEPPSSLVAIASSS